MFNDLLRNDGIRRGPFGSSLKKDIFVPDTKDSYAVYEQRNAINNSFKTRYFIDQSKYDELHNFHLHTNDIIMSGAGTIGKLAKVPTGFRKGVFNQALIRFRINDKVNVNYFLTFMNTPKMQRKLTEANPGSAMVNLVPMKELKKWQILIPQLEEQNKIEKLLTQVNKLLDLYQRKLDLLKQLKRGMLQKLFADNDSKQPELRFDEFNEDWEQRKLGEVVLVNSGKDYKQLNQGEIPVYGTGGYITSVSGKLSDEDAIGLGRKGTINKPYMLKAPFWTVDTLFFLTEKENSKLSFLFPLIQRINWLRYDESTGLPSLSKNNIEKVKVSLPKINEQRKIGQLISQVDSVLVLYQSKIDTLTNLKKFLLQQIFI